LQFKLFQLISYYSKWVWYGDDLLPPTLYILIYIFLDIKSVNQKYINIGWTPNLVPEQKFCSRARKSGSGTCFINKKGLFLTMEPIWENLGESGRIYKHGVTFFVKKVTPCLYFSCMEPKWVKWSEMVWIYY
jgi:hypothetical protein